MPLNNKPKNKVGRPSLYSDELASRMAIHIRHGATLREAAVSEGITYETAREWTHSKPEFAAILNMAKAQLVTDNLANIRRHATKDWRASEKLLVWADSKRFGPKVEVEISINQLAELSDEELHQIVTNSQLPNQITSSGLIGIEEETETVIVGELVP